MELSLTTILLEYVASETEEIVPLDAVYWSVEQSFVKTCVRMPSGTALKINHRKLHQVNLSLVGRASMETHCLTLYNQADHSPTR